MDPVQGVLIAKRPRLSLPLVSGQIFGQVVIGNRVHHKLCDIDLDQVLIVRPPPEAQPAIYMMLATTKQVEHLEGVLATGRLSENLPLTFGHCVTADNNAAIDPRRHIPGLLKGESSDEL